MARRRGTDTNESPTDGSHQPDAEAPGTSNSPWQQKMELRVKKYEGPLEKSDPDEFSMVSAISNVLNLAGNDDTEEAKCAICLSTVEVGDRIGDIPCGHIYCVECLKDWLKRKNHCPLCMRGGLATPAVPDGSPSLQESDTSVVSSSADPEEGVEVAARQNSQSSSGSSGLIVSLPDIFRGRRSSSSSG